MSALLQVGRKAHHDFFDHLYPIRSDATSMPKGINMTECPAYVETRRQPQQNTNDDHIYECIGLPFHTAAEACDHHYEETRP